MGTVTATTAARRALLAALIALALTSALVAAGLTPPASAVDDGEDAPAPSVSITKTVSSGVEFDDDGGAHVVVTGGATHDIAYDFEIANTGTEDLTDLTLSDDRIGDLTADLADEAGDGVLEVGETVTVTAVHEGVGADTFEGGLLVNVGVVTASGTESGEPVSAEDDETVFDVELSTDPPTVEAEEPPANESDDADDDTPGPAEDADDGEAGDGEVEVLAEVLTDPDAEDTLPETGTEHVGLGLLGLLLTLLGGAALALAPRQHRDVA